MTDPDREPSCRASRPMQRSTGRNLRNCGLAAVGQLRWCSDTVLA
jgi:hypothetical protein